MSYNITYQPDPGLAAVGAMLIGHGVKAQRDMAAAEQRRNTALAALQQVAGQAARNGAARGYSGGDMFQVGGGGGGGNGEDIVQADARSIGGVNATPAERARIASDLRSGKTALSDNDRAQVAQSLSGSRRGGQQGPGNIGKAAEFSALPEEIRRATYAPEDQASVDRIETQQQGYMALEQARQQGNAALEADKQGNRFDVMATKNGMATRAQREERRVLEQQLQVVKSSPQYPDDVKAQAVAAYEKRLAELPSDTPPTPQEIVKRQSYTYPSGVTVYLKPNGEIQTIKDKDGGGFSEKDYFATEKEMQKDYVSAADSLTKTTDDLQAQLADVVAQIQTAKTTEEYLPLRAKLDDLKTMLQDAGKQGASLQKPTPEAIARRYDERQKSASAAKVAYENIQKGVQPQQVQQSQQAAPEAMKSAAEQLQASVPADKLPQVEKDLKSLKAKIESATGDQKAKAKAAMAFYMENLKKGVYAN